MEDRIIFIMAKASNGAAYQQEMMFSLKILAQQFCWLAATVDRRLS